MTKDNSPQLEGEKKITFKKGIYTINFPFMLTMFEPWQDQIKKEIKKLASKYTYRKSARIGYEITESGASIKLYKN